MINPNDDVAMECEDVSDPSNSSEFSPPREGVKLDPVRRIRFRGGLLHQDLYRDHEHHLYLHKQDGPYTRYDLLELRDALNSYVGDQSESSVDVERTADCLTSPETERYFRQKIFQEVINILHGIHVSRTVSWATPAYDDGFDEALRLAKETLMKGVQSLAGDTGNG